VRADDRAHVFHSWSAQALIDPLPVAAGEGSTFWDYDGNAYLDFSSQLVNLNLGHQHPDLVAAIQEQAGRLATIQPALANDVRGELARRIAEVAPGDLNRVFFTNGGADANEHAVRMARAVTGRRKVLSMYRSYHGGTATAISLTGDPRRWANEPSDGSVVHFLGPYPYRSSFHADSPEQETERALAEVLDYPSRLNAMHTVYAMTIHRGQGSQYDTVSIVLPDETSAILTRQLLYTAVTRARRRVRIVGDEHVVRAAVERQALRASGLGRGG
jgi:taurine--2-oxoglutarate transaminase